MTFGDRIRRLRSRSPFPERKTFAFRAGISSEGLRKIENGSRIPERTTIDKILEVAGCPANVTEEILNEWSKTQATKLGVRIQTDHSPAVLADIVIGEVENYIEHNEWSIPENWKEELRIRMTERLKDVVQSTRP